MQFSFDKKNNFNLYLQYTAVFFVVALFVYGTYLATGHSLIWRLDGAQQHLPLLSEFRKTLLSMLNHPTTSLPQWSWKLGLGGDLFQINSYYIIGDLFNYLILLFPATKVVLGYQILIVLRLYCAGLSFCYFAAHFKFHNQVIISGSLVYLFNAFLLYSNIAQPFFTLPFILFPLLILCVERVLQGYSNLPLTLMFSWMLFNNFYFAYILGIGTFIFLILRYFFYYRHQGIFKKTVLKLGSSTLLSLLLTAVLLLPEIYAVFNSTRSSGSFANGLKLYPLYYYLALPSQLINGGNRDFYFWSALGFASLSFFALLYIIAKHRNYPILSTSFILGGIMLLFPACGAFFNGMTSPSNRWTLLLVLPLALATCVLINHIKLISPRMLRAFTFCLLGYSLLLLINYFFQNNEKLFIPVIFLFISYGLIVFYRTSKNRHWQLIFMLLLISNTALNAVYFAAPYNGGYSNEMLPQKAFEKWTALRYAGLDRQLKPHNQYRVSTISQNYSLGAGIHMYNTQPSKLNSISSYYSLQNKNIGNFASSMHNSQFEANIPLGQMDDRTILNNFLGVRYLFVQANQPNDTKIPAGYTLDKAATRNLDANQHSTNDQQTLRYRTKYAFPLLYWQNTVISAHTYRHLSASEKERALASGVYLGNHSSKGYQHATLAKNVVTVPYTIISSRGNLISTQKITREDRAETYTIILKNPEKYRNSELHLDFENLDYTPFSLKKQLQLDVSHETTSNSGLLSLNQRLSYYSYLRAHVLKGTPDKSYSLSVSSSKGTEKITQPNQDELSFYKTVNYGLMNLGFFSQLPASLTISPSKLGTYRFKLKITATQIDNQYFKEVKQLQKQRLKQLKFTANHLSGTITTKTKGILTSSIPYSKGWSARVDGRTVKPYQTNTGFLGIPLKAGSHQVEFSYRTPGLRLGAKISLFGLFCFLAAIGWQLLVRRWQLNN
ncbi:YfhO family protein [Liquorilactobacillus satsumensis]|uniref:YfhO family protein n=1 Tax=Liquorilactobacillus satsumensis TaxID=259059 RepID=UPI0021C371DD|nr:YfhO family protein [Liquorilactobacillus satsumensis]MCP9329726.1 YfhO family protein [Liquorilactobacillus satsumensis]